MTGGVGDRVADFARAVSAGDAAAMRSFLADDYFGHARTGDEPSQADRWADFVPAVVEAFPDLRVDLGPVRVDGDGLAHLAATVAGTHRGPLWGGPATGESVRLELELTLREVDGRWAIEGESSPSAIVATLRQIGVVPPADRMHLPPPHPTVPPEFLLKLAFTGAAQDKPCAHLAMARVFEPAVRECLQCVALGDIWPSLRMCLVCGFVGCCDTSVNKHMRAHYEATGHPIFRAVRLTEGWSWCYEDSAFFEARALARLAATASSGSPDVAGHPAVEAGA